MIIIRFGGELKLRYRGCKVRHRGASLLVIVIKGHRLGVANKNEGNKHCVLKNETEENIVSV